MTDFTLFPPLTAAFQMHGLLNVVLCCGSHLSRELTYRRQLPWFRIGLVVMCGVWSGLADEGLGLVFEISEINASFGGQFLSKTKKVVLGR